MIVVGLTGGIGSGKSTVAKIFEEFKIPIYVADDEAKLLMNTSEVIRSKLIRLFGENAYLEGKLNRKYLADIVFNDKDKLDKMNAIVHPEVANHFKAWLKDQQASYVIKEAAIIFEHNKQGEYDFVITVIADEDKRIERVMARDHTTPEKVQAIMKHQISDVEKAKLSDFVIVNNDLKTMKSQVQKIHKSLLDKA